MFDSLLFLAAMVLGILAAIDQNRSLIHLDLQRITKTALAVILLGLGLSQVVPIVLLSVWPGRLGSSSLRMGDWEYFGEYVMVHAVVYIAISLVALLRLYRYSVSLRPPEFAPPMTEGPAS